jgi:hypothetical protein
MHILNRGAVEAARSQGETTIKLISNNSPEEVEREAKLGRVKHKLNVRVTKLVANILRVLADGGQRGDIALDIIGAYDALREYLLAHDPDGRGNALVEMDFADELPSQVAGDLLQDAARFDMETAKKTIRQAMLRNVAARLLGQDIQVRRTESELQNGFDRLGRAIVELQNMSPGERRRRKGEHEKLAARLIEWKPAISIYPEEWNKERLEAARRKRKPAADEPG